MKKIVALLLAVVMVFGLMPFVSAEETTKSDDIVILHTNDIHCGVKDGLGIAGVAAYKAEMETANKYVTLVDCGDATHGETVGMISGGTYVVDMMNKAGYDYAIFGNHEFDYKMPGTKKIVDKAEYQFISCNFTYEGEESDDAVDLDPYVIDTYGDVKVAFVGVTTPESFSKSTPAYFKNADGEYIYSFAEGNDGADLFKAVQTAVDGAKAEGADYVVVLAHLGIDGTTAGWTSEDVIKNTTGIDAMLDGHSHEEYTKQVENKAGEKVWLQQTGTKLANLGKLVISKGELTCELISSEAYTAKDETVAAYVDGIFSSFEDDYKEVVAKSEVLLSTKDANGNRIIRNTEAALGDLCADAYRIMMNADVGIMNGGGIRADIKVGDITKNDLMDIFPWGNLPCKVEVSGQTLLNALELGASKYPGENGGFLHVSGLKYTINEAMSSNVKLNDKGEFVKVDGDYRVTNVQVLKDGEYVDLDLTAKYTLAGVDYTIVYAGDGFTMFNDAKVVTAGDASYLDSMLLTDYIVEKLGGTIGEDYAASAARITINSFVDVLPASWFYEYVMPLYQAGIINGMSKTAFAPKGTLTWAQALKLLLVAHGDLSDVTGDTWSDVTMAKATELDLITASTKAASPISRLDFCKVAAKLYEIADSETATIFSDCDDATVMALVDAGVISGYPDGTFQPEGTLNRGEIAKIIFMLTK